MGILLRRGGGFLLRGFVELGKVVEFLVGVYYGGVFLHQLVQEVVVIVVSGLVLSWLSVLW